MITAPHAPAAQLSLDLRGAPCGTTRGVRPYWEQVDLADLGGELRAKRSGVRVLLGADADHRGLWTGYFDLVVPGGGIDGSTKPMPSRRDALVTSAHRVARYCENALSTDQPLPRDHARAAGQVLGWLGLLDVL